MYDVRNSGMKSPEKCQLQTQSKGRIKVRWILEEKVVSIASGW
jgi:hypothetical protein